MHFNILLGLAVFLLPFLAFSSPAPPADKCRAINNVVGALRNFGPSVTAFCSSYLSIQTATSTATVSSTVIPSPGIALTTLEPVTDTVTATTTQTVTATTTEYQTLEAVAKAKRAVTIPKALSAFAGAKLSSACFCLAIPTPTVTTTTTTLATLPAETDRQAITPAAVSTTTTTIAVVTTTRTQTFLCAAQKIENGGFESGSLAPFVYDARGSQSSISVNSGNAISNSGNYYASVDTPSGRDGVVAKFSLSHIDGVLLRSSAPIPGASESLHFLQTHRIPFILLTNGGGKHESERVSDISLSLSLSKPLTTKNFIQSHTPMADFLHTFPHHPTRDGLPSDSTILVVGGERNACRLVAESYGFRNVLTPGDVFTSYPEIWPFSHVFGEYYSSFAKPLPGPINPTTTPSTTSSSLKIDAILIFNDPRDWALDIQLILDILLSHRGILGTISPKNGDSNLPNNGYQQDDQPPLYFSNPDLLWAAGYHLPRLGQGGFHAALEGVWRRVTGGRAELQATVIGKPSSHTYEFAEKRLKSYRRDLVHEMEGKKGVELKELRKVYMVGDNPESDIMGANNYRSPHRTDWVSVLVRTGVFEPDHVGQGRRYDLDVRPELEPKVIVEDVREAVRWALRDAGWQGESVD